MMEERVANRNKNLKFKNIFFDTKNFAEPKIYITFAYRNGRLAE